MVKLRHGGFSLVEIVLAVGLVSIALLAIFGLFGTSLRSNSDTLSQHEVLGVTRSFGDFLQATNGGAGFNNVFDWVKTPTTAPELYAFAAANGTFTCGLGTNTTFITAVNQRPARLFRLVVALSPNMPIRDSTGTLIPRPTTTSLPATTADYKEAVLALQVQVYSVAAPAASIANLLPVFTFETTIRR